MNGIIIVKLLNQQDMKIAKNQKNIPISIIIRGGISQEEWDKIYNKYFELEW